MLPAPKPGTTRQTKSGGKRKNGKRLLPLGATQIVDEAHSSQTGETARELKAVLGAGQTDGEDDEQDWEDGLNAVMESRGHQPNLSFFAFTATPKGKTLELFGRPVPGGKPDAAHIYS